MTYPKVFSVCIISILILNGELYPSSSTTSSDSISYYYKHIIVTANRYEKNIFETNIPATVVQQNDVWQRGVANLGELVQPKAGINFTDAGPWSQKLVVRGLVGPQVLTLVDGMKLNILRSYGNHAPLIDPEQIERVEIIRGPASILYGSDAIGGVVNLITKKPVNNLYTFKMKCSIGLQYNSVNQQRSEQISFTSSLPQWNFLLNLTNRQAEDINTPGGKLKNTEFNGYTIDAQLGYKPDNHHTINIKGQTNRMTNVGIPINQYAKRAKFLKYNQDMINLTYEFHAPQTNWTNYRMNLFYQQGQRNFDAYIHHKPNGPLFVNQLLNAKRNVKGYGANFQSSFLIGKNNLLTSGVDIFTEFDDTHRIADLEIMKADGTIAKDPPADTTPPTPKSNRKGVGVFMEEEFSPLIKWTFTFGVRFDYIVSQADATPGTLTEDDIIEIDQDVSANFGVLYHLTKHINLITNIGRAFKAPTLQERFFNGTAQVGYLHGNPHLNSENSLNIDAGVKWNFSNFTGEFNLFRNQVNDYIVMKPISAVIDTLLYDNVGKAELYGGEFEAIFNLTNHFSIKLNAAYVHGNDINTNVPLPKMPPLEGLLGLRYESTQNIYWIELTGRFVNSQNRVVENELKTNGYNLFHFSSGLNVAKFFSWKTPIYLTFNIHNILNTSYRDHLSDVTWWDAPGRNIVIGLRMTF